MVEPNLETTPRQNDQQLAGLIEEYRNIAEAPPGDDGYIGNFADAMAETLSTDQTVRNLATYVLGIRRSQDIEHTAHVIRVSFQRQLQHEDGYPFHTITDWSDAIHTIVNDPPPGFLADMIWRNIQTNVPERYKSLVISLPFLAQQRGVKKLPLQGLDVGTSHMQGPKKVSYMHKYPFQPATVVEPDRDEGYAANKHMQTRVNRLLKKKPWISKWVGIDLWPLRDNYELQWDIENDEWIRTCSFRLTEVAEGSEALREFDKLADEPIPRGFSYRDINFSDEDTTVTDQNGEPMLFDFAFCSTSLYQAEAGEERAAFIRNGERHLKDDGLLIIQDSVRLDDSELNGLRFYGFKGDVPEYSYTTLVKDMREPEAGFQEVWRWDNSRCRQLLVDLGALGASGKFSRRVAKHLVSG